MLRLPTCPVGAHDYASQGDGYLPFGPLQSRLGSRPNQQTASGLILTRLRMAGTGGSRTATGLPAASPEDPADQRVRQLLAGIGKVQPIPACEHAAC